MHDPPVECQTEYCNNSERSEIRKMLAYNYSRELERYFSPTNHIPSGSYST
jgi:hypothetical protein